MARHHLKFKNFHEDTIKATNELFESKPWRGDDYDRYLRLVKWVGDVAAVYGIPAPEVVYAPGLTELMAAGGACYHEDHIYLATLSVLSTFHEFRHHMQRHLMDGFDEEDSRNWSCSLFYRVRPTLFRKAVRDGRVYGVEPADLLKAVQTEEVEQGLSEIEKFLQNQ